MLSASIWGICGAALGGYAARRKARSIGVGIVLGVVLGPFAALLLLARKAPPDADTHEDTWPEAIGGCFALAVLTSLVLGIIAVVAAARSGARLCP